MHYLSAVASAITSAFFSKGTFRRSLALGASTLAAILVSSPQSCGTSDENTNTSPCPSSTACTTGVTFLHTSDIHSRLFPYELLITQSNADLGLGTVNAVANVGGGARISYIIGREKAQSDRAIYLDSGDYFQGDPVYNFFRGEPEIRVLSAMGVDAAVLGNHEFDSGALLLAKQLQNWSTFGNLAANYNWDDPAYPNYAQVANIVKPFRVVTKRGLKVGVIGMANLQSMAALFQLPNRQSITPLNTVEIAQSYIDLLRPYVDLIVMVTHLGLEADQRMVRNTTGIDVVLGGHNHIVLPKPEQLKDCSANLESPGFIWTPDPSNKVNMDDQKNVPDDTDPSLKGSAGELDPVDHPWQTKRKCTPRNVLIAHSGAFAQFVGRLDLLVSNDPNEMSQTSNGGSYETINGYEVVSSKYKVFPVNSSVPVDPVVVQMLEPYRRTMDIVTDLNLNILAGYCPEGALRISPTGGDSPLGNMLANAMWLKLGVQTDFAYANTPGLRTDLLPGPVTVEQFYNIFPFDNYISKMQLSGLEVWQLFDNAARRSVPRGCATQAQVAGARARLNCGGCNRTCEIDDDCPYSGICDPANHSCYIPCGSSSAGGNQCPATATCGENGRCIEPFCAEAIYVGHTAKECRGDGDCVESGSTVFPGQCDLTVNRCMPRIKTTNLYELATNDYLSTGGDGYRVLERNTTQVNTRIQMRDALLDYIRNGKPCGYDEANNTPDGLKTCQSDSDCGEGGTYVCSCPGNAANKTETTCQTIQSCAGEQGRCVLSACRDSVSVFRNKACEKNPDRENCRVALNACSLGGEECKYLACVDRALGNFSDGRIQMVGR